MKFSMTRQKKRPFNTGECLIEVTLWSGLTELLDVRNRSKKCSVSVWLLKINSILSKSPSGVLNYIIIRWKQNMVKSKCTNTIISFVHCL
jgi:hypothetical protein